MQHLGLAEAEHRGAYDLGRRQQAGDAVLGAVDEGYGLACAPYRQCNEAAGDEHAVHFGERAFGVGKDEQRQPCQHAVHAGVGQAQLFGVSGGKARGAGVFAAAPGAFGQHALGNVGGEHGAAGGDAQRGVARQQTRSAGKVEDALAGGEGGGIEQGGGELGAQVRTFGVACRDAVEAGAFHRLEAARVEGGG